MVKRPSRLLPKEQFRVRVPARAKGRGIILGCDAEVSRRRIVNPVQAGSSPVAAANRLRGRRTVRQQVVNLSAVGSNPTSAGFLQCPGSVTVARLSYKEKAPVQFRVGEPARLSVTEARPVRDGEAEVRLLQPGPVSRSWCNSSTGPRQGPSAGATPADRSISPT